MSWTIFRKVIRNYWTLGLLGFCTIELLGIQTIGPSDYWVFGLSGLQTIGPSDYWADTTNWRFLGCWKTVKDNDYY